MRNEIRQLTEVFSEIVRSVHQRSYHKLENKNVYPGQPKLLFLIKANEGITQKELSKKNFVKPATITGMLNKLEANHYVYRIPDETDKRIMRVYLTPEGRRLADHTESFMENMAEQLFHGFSDEELKTLLILLEKTRNNLYSKHC